MLLRHAIAAGALCALAVDAAASCGSAFCIVNTDWTSQGARTDSALRFDLRYEYIDQDQPRHGTDRVGVGAIPADHDEVYTRNNNWFATVDWNVAPAWSVSLVLPYIDREHFHIRNDDDGEKHDERWHLTGVGDMRVTGRYQVSASADPASPSSTGLFFGLKLPTGAHDLANGDGEVAERSLQPGSGTTDGVLGFWWHGGAPLAGWTWWTRLQGQAAMNSKDGFKPGNQVQLDGGVRRAIGDSWAFMLQANALWKGRDSGENAEPDESGQSAVFLSPGMSWNLSRDAQLYAFVQVPLWQKVNGVQLTADWSALAGVSWRF